MTAQLHARDITVERGGNTVLAGVSLTVAPGDRIGLVGPNGVGKSTLLQVLAGGLAPTSGAVELVPAEATVGLLAQELDSPPGESVAGYLARRTGVAAASAALDEATEALADATAQAFDRHQAALDRWLRLGGADLEARAATALAAVGLAGPGSAPGTRTGAGSVPGDRAGAGAGTGDQASGAGSGPGPATMTAVLSGGEQARVGLAALMLARYDVVLLDEPTNNLDGRGLDQLEDLVLASAVPLVVVSHDRRFLERVVTSVVELDDHRPGAVRYNEPWRGYLAARELARAEAQRRYQVYTGERSRLDDRARQQREWATKGVKAERRSPDNDRAARGYRIDRTEKLASKARQTERARERLDEVDKPWEPWQLRFTIGRAERSGDLVAELVDAVAVPDRPQLSAAGAAGDGARPSAGGEPAAGETDVAGAATGRDGEDRAFVLGPVTVSIGAGERVAILGGNGQGKSTLLQALFGRLPLQAGIQRVGRSVIVGWLDQGRHAWSATTDFLRGFTEETGLVPSEARSLLAKFGLEAEDLTRPPARWSPGERTRAALAGFAARGVNTIVLDEPTNHLDLPAIEQLEQALTRFDGTLLVVTHDRAFLDNLTLTRRLQLDGGLITTDTPW